MVLFLDFDGVLHPVNRPDGALSLLPHVERVLRDYPHVEIVISSAWRTDNSIDTLRAFFSSDIAARIIGVTPDFYVPFFNLDYRYIRELEIRAWLKDSHREHESWIALDDIEILFKPGCPGLLLVDADIGFNQHIEKELRKRLDVKER
jgi:hypothetical protein